MRASALRAGTLVAAFLSGSCGFAATSGCGPDYVTDDSRIAPLLAKKKKDLGRDYPAKLIALLDKGSQCVARIEREPDSFSFVFVHDDGSIDTPQWTQEDETLAQQDLKSGKLRRYWIVNSRRAFSCCNDKAYNQMSDYDSADDVNASQAIKCTKGSAC